MTYKQYPDITIPAWLESADDASYHNDAMPHSFVWIDEEKQIAVDVWVNYADPNDREVPGAPHYIVLACRNEDQLSGYNSQVIYEGEDEDAARAAMAQATEMLRQEQPAEEK